MNPKSFAGERVRQTTIEALRATHDKICKLLEDYLKLEGESEAEAGLADSICEAFDTLHAFEEQVLYPEIREANKIVARSLARSDRKIAMQIAFIRAAGDAKRGRAVIELIEFFHAKVCTCEQFVFPFGQWRVPADPLSARAGTSRQLA